MMGHSTVRVTEGYLHLVDQDLLSLVEEREDRELKGPRFWIRAGCVHRRVHDGVENLETLRGAGRISPESSPRSVLTDPPVVRHILRHLGIPDRPPLLSPARAPPQAEIAFDQTPALDPILADPNPELDLDQSLPDE